ncbi:hypothetical protein Y032_0387g478 [Ancylostoma ceylanicum]|uniref:Uncharacterized protein n=1 Tax=Ancylostoma ceylanicum TaxID=53326 RepID=A0A016RSN3_9BILA|nr:hypothetical protein Y032_0387g478 [Ancylostoma ceylanicum]
MYFPDDDGNGELDRSYSAFIRSRTLISSHNSRKKGEFPSQCLELMLPIQFSWLFYVIDTVSFRSRSAERED